MRDTALQRDQYLAGAFQEVDELEHHRRYQVPSANNRDTI